jgi:sugar phosphate isomerase/epimerase
MQKACGIEEKGIEMKRKIGFMPNGSYNSMSAEEVCKSLKRIGYDCVEWTQTFASPRQKSVKELKELVRISQDNGLEISEIVVQQDLVLKDEQKRKDNIAYILECIRAYSEAGIDTINLFTGPIPWIDNPLKVGKDISEGEAWGMVFSAFDEILPVAEESGMNLAVENVWGMLCRDFFTNRYLIDHYKSPYLGVNYDPSHDILAGHLDVGWIIENWGKNIKHVHLKDAVGIQEDRKFIFPLPGEGNVDWKSFHSALDRAGYKGPMSVEFESFVYVAKVLNGDWEKAAELSLNNFRLLFDY